MITGWGWTPPGAFEEVIPDVMVHPETTDRARFTGVPLLCVEITSGNRTSDLMVKRAKYAAAGLRDYWVVDRRDHALLQCQLRDEILQEVDRATGHGPVTATFAGRSVSLDLDRILYAR